MKPMKAKDYPLPYVEIGCDHCGRYGRMLKQTFVDLVGPDTELPQALEIVAKDCPIPSKTADYMHGECNPGYLLDWWKPLKDG